MKLLIKIHINFQAAFNAILLLLMISIISCEEKTEWNLHTEELNTIVVEGRLTNEFKHHEIQISHPLLDMNEIPKPFMDANVSVSFGLHEVLFLESDETPGYYYSEVPFRAIENVNYFLEISIDTAIYSAETYIVPVHSSNSPNFYYNPEKELYKLSWNIYQFNPFEQAMFEAIISWDHLPGYDHPDSLSQAKMLFYALKTIDVSYIVSPQAAEEVYFPGGSIAIISKYSINEEYGEYLRALLIESNWQGSLFEGARSNVPGNISNSGLGFFSACSVKRDTLIVQ